MESCDVLIVGGGPAGSSCAWRLRGAGLDVVVLDKSEFPRDKVCAGWITPAIIEELQLDAAEYGHGRTFQPITGFRIGLLGGGTVDTHYPRPISFGIRRCEFDHYLLQRSGARLRLGTPFESARRSDGGWIVNEAISAPVIVGAGGHFCPVARSLGAQLGAGERAVAAQEIEFELDAKQGASCLVEPERPEIYFCEDLQGYGWCVRKGAHLNVGLGRLDKHRLAQHVADFRAFLIEQGRIAADTPQRFRGHAYLAYQDSSREPVADGVLLIGDAVGLAYPQSGEGIRPAVESGIMAADAILAARGAYSRAKLQAYARALAARFGARSPAGRLPDLIPVHTRRALARMLLSSRLFAHHVVMNRWFLHIHEPALASHGTTIQPAMG